MRLVIAHEGRGSLLASLWSFRAARSFGQQVAQAKVPESSVVPEDPITPLKAF